MESESSNGMRYLWKCGLVKASTNPEMNKTMKRRVILIILSELY